MARLLILFGMVTNEEVLLLLEDLGLIHSSFITPTVIELLEREIQCRQFDLPDYDRMYINLYLSKLRERREFERKRKKPTVEKSLKLNF